MHARPFGCRTGLAVLIVLALPFALAACGGSDNDDPKPPPALTVSADPAGDLFPGALTVRLNSNVAATIHYTMDLSTPDDTSPVYGAAIPISANTVIKFFGIDGDGVATDVMTEGYTIGSSGSIQEEWAMSGHGMITNEAWRHWDEEGEVETDCAKCHSTTGLADFAMDGMVDAPAALSLGLGCAGCHQSENGGPTLYDDLGTYPHMDPIEFPSGISASLHGNSNLCMACHQGRSAGKTVDDEIATGAGPYDFKNIHYYPAAAVMFGGRTKGGYEYEGMEYVGQNVFPSHTEEFSTCTGCHMRGGMNDHTMKADVNACNTCHGGAGITEFEELAGSPKTNHDAIEMAIPELYLAIQAYATNTIMQPIVYDSHAYPYFFNDLNGNGEVDEGEASYGNKYAYFDAELLKAAYNYQVAQKEPCGYIHNGTYIRQLLYDSTMAIGGMPTEVPPGRDDFDATSASKTDQWKLSGHGDALAEAFRHWDEEDPPEVASYCAKCHTTSGYEEYVATESNAMAYLEGETVECTACHVDADLAGSGAKTRWAAQDDGSLAGSSLLDVLFPSGVRQSMGDDSNMCMACHQGRASGLTVVNASPNTEVQDPDYDSYDLINRHYYAAAAITYGSAVTAGFEYADKTYSGLNTFGAHGGIGKQSCVECHMRGTGDHTWEIPLSDCSGCHGSASTSFDELNHAFAPNTDWDGNTVVEGFKQEIDGMAANLLVEIYAYAKDTLGYAIVYAPHYPYFFNDLDGDGEVDEGEDTYGNPYKHFDKTLLEATYNFLCAQDPCGGIHNYRYVLQTVYDSLDTLDNGARDGSAVGTRP